MWIQKNAASVILKNPNIFNEFFAKVSKIPWGADVPPSGAWDAGAIKNRLIELAEAKYGFAAKLSQNMDEVVTAYGTPALLVKGGKPVTDSPHWAETIGSKLDVAIPAVGRLKMFPSAPTTYLATAWFVRQGVVLTNGHVADNFSYSSAPYEFLGTEKNGSLVVKLDTIGEDEANSQPNFLIKKVLYRDEALDIAYLQIEQIGNAQIPPLIEIDSTVPSEGDFAAIIGYPGADADFTDTDLDEAVFNGIYDVKRVLVGEIGKNVDGYLLHSCPTSGGCSGAPLISLKTAKVVGLHLGGTNNKSNFAIPAVKILESLTRAGL